MTRIATIFAEARAQRRGLVLPFVTGGYPRLDLLDPLLDALERAGAAVAEVGFPFSDPIADGPVIAASMHEALGRGVTPKAIFDVLGARAARRSNRLSDGRGERSVEGVARESGSGQSGAAAQGGEGVSLSATPIATVAMVSTSIVVRSGVERFVRQVSEAGMDGVIVPDADLDVASDLTKACERVDLGCTFLVAPTSSPERVRRIVGLCRGFVYLLARAGVTGEQRGPAAAQATSSDDALKRQVDAIRAADPNMPIAAGFGIATPEHVRSVLRFVDGAIVGSALVRRIGEAVVDGRDPVTETESLVRALVAAAELPR